MALPPGPQSGKDPAAFRTIREVSEQLGVPPHVLRFWETRFPELKPLQRGGNRRYYRPADVAFAAALHRLLHQDGYTVKGVRKLISEHGTQGLVTLAGGEVPPARASEGRPSAPAEPEPKPVAATDPSRHSSAAGPTNPPADPELVAELRRLRDRLAAALAA